MMPTLILNEWKYKVERNKHHRGKVIQSLIIKVNPALVEMVIVIYLLLKEYFSQE